MKTSRSLSLILALLLLFLPAFAEAPFVVTDMLEREVTLKGPARRVVVLQPGDAEILYAIGAQDVLIGRGEYVNYPQEVLSVPSVQSGYEINFEQIIALNPDVVIMTKMGQKVEDQQKLLDAGIQTFMTDAQTVEDVYEAVALLGQLTGKTENAEEVVASMKAGFDALSEKAAGKSGVTVYFEASPLEFGLWTTGKNTFMDDIAGILNLDNIFADVEGWNSVSEEQVLSRDPDIIVTTTMYFGEGPTPVEEIMARANWGQVKAVKNNKVFNADADAITRPGPRLVDAAEALYSFVYGE
ncbi:MAG: ABC transporter substrate-binding protein [Bacillota bacterium]|nr:ABC transporter substrate-binding protein [Bacillota bacterium]